MSGLSASDRARFLEEALAILQLDEGDRDSVIEELECNANALRDDLVEPSISLKRLCDRLDKIEADAAALAKLLGEYSADLEIALPFDPIFELTGWPQTSIYQRKQFDINALRDLSANANFVRGELVNEIGNGNVDFPDPNGASIRNRLHGTAKRRFVSNIMPIFENFRPDALTTSKKGDLVEFVVACWLWATGGYEPKGLADDLANVVPQLKNVRDQSIISSLENCARNCLRLGLVDTAAEFQSQADKLSKRIRSSGDK